MSFTTVQFRAGFAGTKTRPAIQCDHCKKIVIAYVTPGRWKAESAGPKGWKHWCPKCRKGRA